MMTILNLRSIPGDENANNPFLHSLDKLSEKDIQSNNNPEDGKPKKNKKGNFVRNIVLIISIAVFVVCGIYLVINLMEKKQGEDLYSDLANKYFNGISFGDSEPENDSESGEVTRLAKAKSAQKVLCLSDRIMLGANYHPGGNDEKLEQMRASITALTEQNRDTYGWISVPGTQINYPISSPPITTGILTMIIQVGILL